MFIYSDRVHRASSSATSGDNYWRKANVADGNYTDDGFCADWDGDEVSIIYTNKTHLEAQNR